MELLTILADPLYTRHRAAATLRNYRSGLLRLALAGVRALSDVTVERVERFMSDRLVESGPIMANQDLLGLLSTLAHLERSGRFSFELLRQVRRLRIPMTGPRALSAPHLSVAEVDLMVGRLESAPWVLRAGGPITVCRREEVLRVVRLATWTGLRMMELSRLRWVDVDMASRLVYVRHGQAGEGSTKTREERSVPICAPLLAFLLTLDRPGQFVISLNSKRTRALSHYSLYDRLRALREIDTGVAKPITFHLFRHTRASWWVQAGVPIVKVAKWLGHSIDVCARFYAGLRADFDPDADRMPA